MSQVPVQLIVAAFTTENGADDALKALKTAKKEQLIGIQNAAVVRRDANNKLHINETADWGGGKGAAVGAVVGGVIGLLFPPSLLVTGAIGAAIGGMGAKLRDSGFPDARLRELGDALTPGTSAIVAVVELKWVADLERALAEEGAKTVREAVAADIAAQLQAGRDVAYSATATGDTVSMSRTAVGADSAEMGNVTMGPEGVTASKVVVDKDTVAAVAMVSTDEGVVAGAMVASRAEAGEAKTQEAQSPEASAGKAPASPAPSSSEATTGAQPPAKS